MGQSYIKLYCVNVIGIDYCTKDTWELRTRSLQREEIPFTIGVSPTTETETCETWSESPHREVSPELRKQ